MIQPLTKSSFKKIESSSNNSKLYGHKYYYLRVYILENTPLGGGISADVIWGKKYEKRKRNRGNKKEKGSKRKEKDKMGSKNGNSENK